MDSSGRGEESPDAYRGVVLPPAQSQPPLTYGEHVQPAGGSPWGSPAPQGAPGGPPQAPPSAPQAADATQMLPPYPAGGPPPAPPAVPPAAPGHGPEATQVLRVQPAGPPPSVPPAMPGAPAPGGPPAADATQMLPPYPGGDPSSAAGAGPAGTAPGYPGAGYDEQQRPPQQPTYEQAYGSGPSYPGGERSGQDYGGQDYPAPGYPGADYGSGQGHAGGQGYPGGGQDYPDPGAGYGGPQQQPQQPTGPQHDSDYDHLFRQDVPSPAPVRPHIIQRPDQQQPAPQYQQQPPPYPGHAGQGGLPGGFETSYDDEDDRGGGRKMSPKVIIGIVVAGCVVAGLVVGGLLNSGGDASADNSPGKGGASASSGPSAPGAASGGSVAADPAEQQAQQLDALLKTSGDSRSQVVSAVASIKNCQDLDTAASDLRAAKSQRTGLVTRLGTLSLDKLPDNASLADALTRAWQASAAADGHYASWAEQAKGKKVCKGGHARGTEETAAGNRESGTATEQKKRAVKLWNTIADKYGLTKRTYGQL